MPEIYDLAIIGLGAMGAATAWQAAGRGARVLGLEQFSIPHELGSSSGHSRMIRLAYYEHPDYVPLLRRAYQNWDTLESESAAKLLYRTGGIYMGTPDGPIVGGASASARAHHLPHEILDRPAIAARFPQFKVPDNFQGLYEPEAGFLLPEKCIAVMCEQAMRSGAALLAHQPLLDWSAEFSTDVTLTTPAGDFRAKTAVFCAGAWTDKLIRDLGIPLLVTRQVLGWVWPSRPELFTLGRFPVWGMENPDGTLDYGFPMMPDNPGYAGLKIARHGPSTPADANTISRTPTSADEAEIQSVVGRRLPDGAGPITALRICMYTNSPDHHFILDRHPAHSNVFVACGFSGHGFKFASVVGEVMADLALENKTKWPVGFLGLSRFGA